MRPIIKLLRSLGDLKLSNKLLLGGAAVGYLASRSIRRSIDDNAIPYLRKVTRVRPINPEDDFKTKITALVFIKTLKAGTGQVYKPMKIISGGPWKVRTPFWNTSYIKNYIWWKYLGNISLNKAKRVIAREVCDHLYGLIYMQRIPIIAARVVLIDWKTGEPISSELLSDKWFSDLGFNNFKVDRLRLQAWGITIGHMSEDTHQSVQYKYANDIDFDKFTLEGPELDNLFTKYNINLKNLIGFALINVSMKFAINLDNNTKNNLTRKLQTLIKNPMFIIEIRNFIASKFMKDKNFRDSFVNDPDKKSFIKNIVIEIINNYVDQQILIQ